MSSGAYWVVTKSGRKFLVVPIRERNEKENDVAFKNGGISGNEMKNHGSYGGALTREEADALFAARGVKEIAELPPGVSPNGYIESLG